MLFDAGHTGSHLDRALRSYFRSFPIGPQPSSYSSGMEQHGGHTYAVLRNINGVLQVYRIRNSGSLKRLKRWPAIFNG